MSFENQQEDLLTAFNQRFNPSKSQNETNSTHVLEDAQYVYDNAIDVSISMAGTQAAAANIWDLMQKKEYSPATWSTHELHPSPKDGQSTVDFIFTMDLLNYCFWSDLGSEERFAIEYRGRKWTGYWSLVAALQRALDEDIPITTPSFWHDPENCTDDVLRHVFRSATAEEIPLFHDRVSCLREAGEILCTRYDGTFATCLTLAAHSATALVNLLATNFPCFNDTAVFQDRHIRILKRAQILVADLWACFQGDTFGEFHDIDAITMFADYRIPQILHHLDILHYSPPLLSHIKRTLPLAAGHAWEVQLRGCSIWAVELVLRAIKRAHPEAEVNAVLIDFFLYDTVKEKEAMASVSGEDAMLPHHRTRGIWY